MRGSAVLIAIEIIGGMAVIVVVFLLLIDPRPELDHQREIGDELQPPDQAGQDRTPPDGKGMPGVVPGKPGDQSRP